MTTPTLSPRVLTPKVSCARGEAGRPVPKVSQPSDGQHSFSQVGSFALQALKNVRAPKELIRS